MPFLFPIGPYYFVEIAKFRAMRLLWANVTAAFGGGVPDPPAPRSRPAATRASTTVTPICCASPPKHSRPSSADATSLTVDPFGFDPHLALNLQRILKEEAHLDAVADPAGGSYYIESLTDALAREAWKLFQQVEAEGGYPAIARAQRCQGSPRRARKGRLIAAPYSGRRQQLSQPLRERRPDSGRCPIAGGCRLAEPFEKIRAAHHRTSQPKRAHTRRSCC